MTYTNADKIVAFEFKAITNDGRFVEGRRVADGYQDRFSPRWASSGGVERDQANGIIEAIEENTLWANPETYPVGEWIVLTGEDWDEDENTVVPVVDSDEEGTYVFVRDVMHYIDESNTRLATEEESSLGRYPEADWKYEVANGDTVLGLAEWREHKREADQ